MTIPTLKDVIGRNLRRLREDQGLRQDEVAELARSVGLEWTQAVVTGIETGRRAVPIEELLLLQGPLDISLPALLDPGDEPVVDLGGRPVKAQHLRTMALGQPLVLALSREDGYAVGRIAARGWDRKLRTIARRYDIPEEPDKNWELKAASLGNAEQKAGRKFNVHPFEIVAASYDLWGHSLTQERDARVEQHGGRGERQARGHVTRGLLSELEAHIKSARRKRR
jgi:transcriptional regulator with XRE-family HTH domain